MPCAGAGRAVAALMRAPVGVALAARGRCRCAAGGAGACGVDADDAGRGIASTVPARIAFGSGPIIRRLAAYRAGQPPGMASAAAMPDRVSPAVTRYWAGVARPGRASTVPGRMRPGSGPMARRLAAYSAGQPPRVPSAAAMPDRVSPGCTR